MARKASDSASILQTAASRLTRDTAEATAGSANEQNLRYAIESSLQQQCTQLSVPWTPYQLDRAVRNEEGQIGYLDVVHGAVIIEYEAPHSFAAGRSVARLDHAKSQAVDYAHRMAREEGRPVSEYALIVCDGAHIAFGDIYEGAPRWERLLPFTDSARVRTQLGIP